MKKIYLFHSGAKIIEEAVNSSDYKEKIICVNPVLKSVLLRGVRKIHFGVGCRYKRLWVDLALRGKEIDDSDDNVIIIFDSPIWMENISYIRERYSNINIVFWYWNVIRNERLMSNIVNNSDAVYSFDKGDAAAYKIKFHPQFYWKKKNVCDGVVYDVLFVGKNKDRLGVLEGVYTEILKNNLRPYFYVVRDKKNDTSKVIELKDAGLEYLEVLELICKSKSILEINQPNQDGLTLRALEALFHEKKLITNNSKIVDYDFYDPGNIKLLNDGVWLDTSFFDSPFKEINGELVKKYTFDSWLDALCDVR